MHYSVGHDNVHGQLDQLRRGRHELLRPSVRRSILPDGSLLVLVGRHGAMKPASKVHVNKTALAKNRAICGDHSGGKA